MAARKPVCAQLSGSDAPSTAGPTKVLFVCLGNICRSPTAEAVFTSVVERAGVTHNFMVDSCGTGGGSSNWYRAGGFSYHEGDSADARMTQVAAARGVRLTSKSRPLRPTDLSEFDVILGMDAANMAAIKRAAEHWKGTHDVPADYTARLALVTDFLQDDKWRRYNEVPGGLNSSWICSKMPVAGCSRPSRRGGCSYSGFITALREIYTQRVILQVHAFHVCVLPRTRYWVRPQMHPRLGRHGDSVCHLPAGSGGLSLREGAPLRLHVHAGGTAAVAACRCPRHTLHVE